MKTSPGDIAEFTNFEDGQRLRVLVTHATDDLRDGVAGFIGFKVDEEDNINLRNPKVWGYDAQITSVNEEEVQW